MRLWSLHPKYLDTKGLTALWRESLLAQHVLAGKTRGYRHHPQLLRFSAHPEPRLALAVYLTEIWREAERRGYRFDKAKIMEFSLADYTRVGRINVQREQLHYELRWLCHKLKQRDASRHEHIAGIPAPDCHPFFEIIEGPIESWEKLSATGEFPSPG